MTNLKQIDETRDKRVEINIGDMRSRENEFRSKSELRQQLRERKEQERDEYDFSLENSQ